MRRYEIKLQFQLVSEGNPTALNTPDLVHEYLAPFYLENPLQEAFYVVCMNRKNRPTGALRVTLGTLTNALVHPREVFRIAILNSAAAICVAHNHPGGCPTPSSADIQVTRQLKDASKAVCIDLLDHVISGVESDDPAGLGFTRFVVRDSCEFRGSPEPLFFCPCDRVHVHTVDRRPKSIKVKTRR